MTPKDQAKIEAAVLEAIDAATKPLREEVEMLKEQRAAICAENEEGWQRADQAEAEVARLKSGGTYMCPHCGLSSPHYHKWSVLHDPKDSDRNRWTVQAEGQVHFHFSDPWSDEAPRLHAQAACDLLNHLEIRNRERADQAEARNKALVEALKEIAQAASETCNRHPTWTPHTGHELLCESARQEIRARAALAAHEERSKALEAPKP